MTLLLFCLALNFEIPAAAGVVVDGMGDMVVDIEVDIEEDTEVEDTEEHPCMYWEVARSSLRGFDIQSLDQDFQFVSSLHYYWS